MTASHRTLASKAARALVGAGVLGVAALAALAAGAPLPPADPASDAPEVRIAAGPVREAATYGEALAAWQGIEDVNAWIAARFEYDAARALQLSETQRRRDATLPIHAPAAFFASPRGVCVDLARFAVETLRVVAPATNPRYLMIEFDPVTIRGNTLRRHWVATYERDGGHYVFADSKRPGHIAGPFASLDDYVEAYARYRGRTIVAHRALPSYERARRTGATRGSTGTGP